MIIRDLKKIFDSSLELLDLFIGVILFSTGMYMVSYGDGLTGLNLIDRNGHIVPLYGLFSNISTMDKWGWLFSIIGSLQIIKLCWYKKPNPYLSACIKFFIAFCFLFLAISSSVHRPVLISGVIFIIISLFSLFSLVRSK